MNRRQKERAVAKAADAETAQDRSMKEYAAAPLMLGGFAVRPFDNLDVVWGAKRSDYPPMETIPTVDRRFDDIVSSIFFCGGTLSEHGLKFKPGVHRGRAQAAIRAWLASFDPKHEHKTATVAWALSEWCENE